MELRQLEYFLMVSKLKSFTQAARHLYVSQPAVTNSIRSLEDELGISLFDRSQKRVVLTTEGKVFYHHVDNVMQGVSKTLMEINNLKNLNNGEISIGINRFGPFTEGAKLLKEFNAVYPHIKIKIVERNSAQLHQYLMDEKIDMAFLFSQYEAPLKNIPLQNDELVLCCSPNHKFRYKNSIDWQSLKGENIIADRQSNFFQNYLEKYVSPIADSLNFAFEMTNVQTIKTLVENDLGISILPRNLCVADIDLVIIPFVPQIFLQNYLCYNAMRTNSHAAEAFISFAENFITERKSVL